MKPSTLPVAITRPAGQPLAIMQFVIAAPGQFAQAPIPEAVAAVVSRAVPDAVSWRIIAPEDVPADRAFRESWRDDGEAVVVDMPSAREIARDMVRAARGAKMAGLDAAFLIAMEHGDSSRQQKAAEAKQRLRDAPADPRLDAAATPADLTAAVEAIIAGF